MSFKDCKTEAERKAYIRKQLSTNYAWATRGLIRIYEHQTQDEQAAGDTKHWNAVGFNGADARMLTYMAKWVLSGKTLTGKFRAQLFRRMPKYAGQLEKLAR